MEYGYGPLILVGPFIFAFFFAGIFFGLEIGFGEGEGEEEEGDWRQGVGA